MKIRSGFYFGFVLLMSMLLGSCAPTQPEFTFKLDAGCRKGPGAEYTVASSLTKGTTVKVQGRNAQTTWLLVQAPDKSTCWAAASAGNVAGDAQLAAVFSSPVLSGVPNTFNADPACDATKSLTVTLTWEPVPDARGYHIYRNGDLVISTEADTKTYVDKPGFANQYIYEIEAFNDYGISARWSDRVLPCPQ
jgi:hypothetical protein